MNLQDIYSQLPTERYCSGCHACAIRCSGGVPAAPEEWVRMRDYLKQRVPCREVARLFQQDKRHQVAPGYTTEFCPLYDVETRRCAVYPVRPLICRMLGFVEWMPCPLERPLPIVPTAHEWMREYAMLGPRPIPRWIAESDLPRPHRGPQDRRGITVWAS